MAVPQISSRHAARAARAYLESLLGRDFCRSSLSDPPIVVICPQGFAAYRVLFDGQRNSESTPAAACKPMSRPPAPEKSPIALGFASGQCYFLGCFSNRYGRAQSEIARTSSSPIFSPACDFESSAGPRSLAMLSRLSFAYPHFASWPVTPTNLFRIKSLCRPNHCLRQRAARARVRCHNGPYFKGLMPSATVPFFPLP